MAPLLSFQVDRVEPASADGQRWRIQWVMHNQGHVPIELRAAWIPHGRFRGDSRATLADIVPADGLRRLEFVVSTAEPAATEVENAFLILEVGNEEERWRVFVRMTVHFDDGGVPRPRIEAVTVQPTGVQ